MDLKYFRIKAIKERMILEFTNHDMIIITIVKVNIINNSMNRLRSIYMNIIII